MVDTTTRGVRKFVTLGDTVKLKVQRPVVIVNFKSKGIEDWELSPISVGKISKAHLAGITLPAGTELIVRDIEEGHWEGNPNVAIWLRIVLKPE